MMLEPIGQLRQLPAQYWLLAVPSTIGAAVLTGIPTAIVPNPLFTRMVPAGPLNYAFWAVTSVLLGLVVATYFTKSGAPMIGEGKVAGGGILSILAIGCPVCNKIVFLILGVSGALTYFAPLQPLIGLISVALLVYALRLRLRQMRGVCPVR
jgi:hypothetical protein